MDVYATNYCRFCEIIETRDEEILFQDEHCVVLKPHQPVMEGHILVAPKQHVDDFAFDPEVSAQTMKTAAKIAAKKGGDFNLITSKGESATQTVFHLHIHLVPRQRGDELSLPWSDK